MSALHSSRLNLDVVSGSERKASRRCLTGTAPSDDPIPVPDGRVLKTLHDAGHYATALPKAMQERAEWQTVAEMLILAAQGQRPVMFAEIAMRQPLHAGKAASTGCKPARKYRIVR
jgi:hypothetical protein